MKAKNTLRPHQIVSIQEDGYSFYGEVMSYPFPSDGSLRDDRVMVRRVPGDPTTLEEVDVKDVNPVIGTKTEGHVQYARVSGGGSFPIDMLRNECATPVNFTIQSDPDNIPWRKAVLNEGETEFVIGRFMRGPEPPQWNFLRWKSFGWTVEPITSKTLES